MKQPFAPIFIALLLISPLIQADEEQAVLPELTPVISAVSDMPVQSNTEGWWGTGYMVGVIPSRSWEKGLFWQSGTVDFLAGVGLTEESGQFPPLEFTLSITPEKKDLWNTFVASGKVVVVKYHRPVFVNPLANRGKYHFTKIVRLYKSFAETESSKKFPKGIETELAYGDRWFIKNRQIFGRIIHVARWGQSVIEHRCTAYVHKGGYYKVDIDEFVTTREWVQDPFTNEFTRKKLTYTRTGGLSIPNVIQLDTVNEDICRYAEDAARSQVEVYIEFTGLVKPRVEVDSGLILNPTIHNILVPESVPSENQK